MNAHTLLELYLALVLIETCVSLLLELVNARFVRQHAAVVPPLFSKTIDDETYEKSVCYTLDKSKLAIADTVVSTVALVAVIYFRVFGIIDDVIASVGLNSYASGIIFIFAVSALFAAVELPLKIYKTFVIENRFGFNKQTSAQWILDGVKATLIGALFSTPLILGIFWFMDRTGQYWWVYAFVFMAVFQVLIAFLFPVFIAPLFNKFVPIDEGALKNAIFAMAEKIGFTTSGIFVMDGSKRSSHANAYFAGFGKSRRIVLFDTLISLLSVEQTTAVLAHEMGHAKKHHIKLMLAYSLVFLFVAFWAIGSIMNYSPLFTAFGFSHESHHAALVIAAFASSPLTFFLAPLFSMLSRRYEFQADRFAAYAVGNSQPLSDALLALSKKSLSNLTPHPLYSFFHYSHPTLFERLQALSRLSEPGATSSN